VITLGVLSQRSKGTLFFVPYCLKKPASFGGRIPSEADSSQVRLDSGKRQVKGVNACGLKTGACRARGRQH
jgi:hypothetical protein